MTGRVDWGPLELIWSGCGATSDTKKLRNHSTWKAWAMLLLFHTGAQLPFPNMVCLHFSVTHRSTATPVAPPASNHRAAPLWTARPGFQSRDSNPLQLNKTSSENSGVGGYLTGESNYKWHLNARRTAGNLTLTTVHRTAPLQVRVTVLEWFSPSRTRQGRGGDVTVTWQTTSLKPLIPT